MTKAGTRVRMSEAYKQRIMGACVSGTHVGPFDPEDPNDCWGCGHEHLAEFGDCVGEVIGPTFDSPDAPEVDVMWEPSGMRYGYHPDDLVEVTTYDPRQRAREKQASRDQDEADLASGKKTREQLRQENGVFSGTNARIDIKPVSAASRYATECEEWQQIAQEIKKRARVVVAFDVSEEQRRRMSGRGARAMTHQKIVADVTNDDDR